MAAMAVVALVSALAAPVQGLSAAEAGAASGPTYRVGPGDVIDIFVWRQPDLSKQIRVLPDGTFNFPLIGKLNAAGKQLSEVEKEIQQRMQRQIRDAEVTATLLEIHNYRVYVLGEVTSPGMFELTAPVTIVQAIAMAGGFTPYADKDAILVQRPGGGEWYDFDYERFLADKDGSSNRVLDPGDTILVQPQKLF